MSPRDVIASEPVGVSPRVDCVFKALMGDPARSLILIDFLNAVIDPTVPFTSVEIKNPVHLLEFVGDHCLTVDVEGIDAQGRRFQIEMQSWNERALKERALYGWADLYARQLTAGMDYVELKPVIAIWILDQNTLRDAPHFHHRFVVCDPARQVQLTRHLEIHTLELQKWRAHPAASSRVDAWMMFFAEAERWSELPPTLRTPALEEAMAVLNEFKTNAEWSSVYRARLDWQRRQLTQERTQAELERALVEKERERVEKERERVEKEQALAEKERALAEKERERMEKEHALAEKEQERVEKEHALAELEELRALLRARS